MAGWNGQNAYQRGVNPYGEVQSPFRGQMGYIPGRLITTPDEVVVREIPTDGSIAVFPLQDFSAIYIKGWENNGTIGTIRYIPDPSQTQKPVQSTITPSEIQNGEKVASETPVSQDLLQKVLDKLEGIEQRLNERDRIPNQNQNQAFKQRGKGRPNSQEGEDYAKQ